MTDDSVRVCGWSKFILNLVTSPFADPIAAYCAINHAESSTQGRKGNYGKLLRLVSFGTYMKLNYMLMLSVKTMTL